MTWNVALFLEWLKSYRNKNKKSPSPLDYKRNKKVIQEKTETARKIFEKEVPKNEQEYKDYKQLFEKIKEDSKKKYFQEKLSFYKNDIINNWKNKKNENRLPKKIALESKKITDQKTIAENFNKFYVNWA